MVFTETTRKRERSNFNKTNFSTKNIFKLSSQVIGEEFQDENQEPYTDPDSKLSNKILFDQVFHNGAFSIYKLGLSKKSNNFIFQIRKIYTKHIN